MKNRNYTVAHRDELIARWGDKCLFCGAENIEFHHRVPLCKGGEDSIENIIPLCHKHHKEMHGCMSYQPNYVHKGRPKSKAPTGYKEVVNLYVTCRVGTADCKRMLGLSEGSHLRDYEWFCECVNGFGVIEVTNSIDHIRSKFPKHLKNPNQRVGRVRYIDGERITYYARDLMPQAEIDAYIKQQKGNTDITEQESRNKYLEQLIEEEKAQIAMLELLRAQKEALSNKRKERKKPEQKRKVDYSPMGAEMCQMLLGDWDNLDSGLRARLIAQGYYV